MKKQSRQEMRMIRKRRIRARIFGTASVPRFCVFRSLTTFRVQVIDDVSGFVLASAALRDLDTQFKNTVPFCEKLGVFIAERCKKQGITRVVFDRSGYRYAGKVRALADGARSAGLEF